MKLTNHKAVLPPKNKTPEYKGRARVDGVEVEVVHRGERIVTGYPAGGRYFRFMSPVHKRIVDPVADWFNGL